MLFLCFMNYESIQKDGSGVAQSSVKDAQERGIKKHPLLKRILRGGVAEIENAPIRLNLKRRRLIDQ